MKPLVLAVLSLCGLAAAGCRQRSDASALHVAAGSALDGKILAQLDGSCADSGCHGAGEDHKLPKAALVRFADQTKAVGDCLANPGNDTPKLQVERCLRSGNAWRQGIGLYRAAVNGPELTRLLAAAAVDDGEAQRFKALVMPPAADAAAFDGADGWQAVRAWLVAQPPTYPGIDDARAGTEALGADCRESISPQLVAQVQKSTGPTGRSWVTVHHDAQLPMFGCPEKNDFPAAPKTCLQAFADRSDWANSGASAGGPAVRVKLLRQLPGRVRGGTRSSPDGRFVGNGASCGTASIEDLAVPGRRIAVVASRDPVFSPDDQRFAFAGMVCPLQPLRAVPGVARVDAQEHASGCFATAGKPGEGVGPLQSLGADVGASDRFTVVNPEDLGPGDDGAGEAGAADPLTFPESKLDIHTFAKDAAGNFSPTVVVAPLRGEAQPSLSPSGALVVERFGARLGAAPAGDAAVDFATLAKKGGYRIRFIDRMRADGDHYDGDADATASTVCLKGNQASFSYDDRFLVTHHYADQQDDAAGAGNSSNVYLYDLVTRKQLQVTRMPAGTFALDPHFRADGWIYFLVRQWGKDAQGKPMSTDYVAATDAALFLN